MMQKELISLFSSVRFTAAAGSDSAASTPPKTTAINAFNTEIASFGYTFAPAVLFQLNALSFHDVLRERKSLLALLDEMDGKHASSDRTLFAHFPYDTPNQHAYLVSRIIGGIASRFRIGVPSANVLSCGHVIDPAIFDLKDFGACPICQEGVDQLGGTDSAERKFARFTPLRVLALATETFIAGKANALFSRNSSLSPAEKSFLRCAMAEFTLEEPARLFRETLPFFYELNPEAAAKHVASATDVLRIATYLSNPESGDLSLTENVRFRITTAHSKRLLAMLDACSNPEEDMLRHRERWLRLGERVHPGSAKNLARFPRAGAAFVALRRNPKMIPSFDRTVERALRAVQVDAELVSTLVRRPGVYLRRLDVMLRGAADVEIVLVGLKTACRGATTKLLFEMSKYLQFRIKQPCEDRVFIVKGVKTKVFIRPDTRLPIAEAVLTKAFTVVTAELSARFGLMPPMGKVYIDSRLAGLVLPFNARGDSNASVSLAKGSRYPVPSAPVLRLFVHWIGSGVDVDLSAVFFDETFGQSYHISYSNLHGVGAAHSGDIQSAPSGASEYIDVMLDSARECGYRYLAMSVISFRGQAFNSFPCFAGFMQRDALKSGAKYEPASVALKFDVSSGGTSRMPLVFDLVTSEIIYVDVDAGKRTHGSVAGQAQKFQALARMAVSLPSRKPTAYDVLGEHVLVRGDLVSTPADADRVFMFESTDIGAVVAEFAA